VAWETVAASCFNTIILPQPLANTTTASADHKAPNCDARRPASIPMYLTMLIAISLGTVGPEVGRTFPKESLRCCVSHPVPIFNCQCELTEQPPTIEFRRFQMVDPKVFRSAGPYRKLDDERSPSV
jgi:hypothetical protein